MMLSAKYKSIFLVGIQMVCIFILLVKIPTLQPDPWAIVVSFVGLILGFWAIVSMKLDNISVAPDVKPDARLVTAGPYKIIRHPMYSAVLLTFFPFIVDKPSYFMSIVYFVLLLTLFIKLNYEEKLLKNHFIDYEEYTKHSWRLIPFVY